MTHKKYTLILLDGFLYMVDEKPKGNVYIRPDSPCGTIKGSLVDMQPTGLSGLFGHVPIDIPILASNNSALSILPSLPEIEDNPLDRRKPVYLVQNNKAGKGGNLTIDVQLFEDLEEAKKWCNNEDHLQIITEWIVTAYKQRMYSEEDILRALALYRKLGLNVDKTVRKNIDELEKKVLSHLTKQPKFIDVEIKCKGEEEAKKQPNVVHSHCQYCVWIPKVDSNNTIIGKYIYE